MNPNRISKVGGFKADIVVIGGGGTGLSAALAAAEKGAKVILLEKQGAPGGTSLCASGLFAAESPAQKRMSIGALKDDVFKIAMNYSHWTIDPRVFRAFIDKSGDTIQWLENKGLQFNMVDNMFPNLEVRGFHSLEPNKKAGPVIIKTLCKYCQDIGVSLLLNCPAKKIILNGNGQLTGVLILKDGQEQIIKAKSAIIATGGYTGNKELLKKYIPAYSDNITFLGPPHMGDGLLMTTEIGAATEGLGQLLLHPHVYRGSVRIDAISQEPSTIWVNKKGERFIDETITFRPTECGNVINRQLDKCIYVLLDQKLKNTIEEDGFLRGGMHGIPEITGVKLTNLENDLQAENVKGGVKIADSWADIAKWIEVEPTILSSTINEYNHFCEQGYDERYLKDRRYLEAIQNPPYYAIRCFLSCLDTIGGIKINQRMEVVDNQDDPIPGLYAGGDAAGGWESETYCILLPGSALGFAINSGRMAGENAYSYILGKKESRASSEMA